MKKLVFCLFVGSLILVPRLLIADACEDCLNKCNNNSYCNATDNKSKRECNRCKNACCPPGPCLCPPGEKESLQQE